MTDSTLIIIDWAAITNHVTDMAEKTGKTLIECAQAYAPQVWEIVRRQVLLDAITSILTWLIAAILFLSIRSIGNRLWHPDTYSEEGDIKLVCVDCVPIGGFVISLLVTVFTSVHAVKVILNLDYYTIKKLLELAGIN